MADSNFQDYASEFGELTLAVSRNIFSIPNLSASTCVRGVCECYSATSNRL